MGLEQNGQVAQGDCEGYPSCFAGVTAGSPQKWLRIWEEVTEHQGAARAVMVSKQYGCFVFCSSGATGKVGCDVKSLESEQSRSLECRRVSEKGVLSEKACLAWQCLMVVCFHR